MGVHDVNFKISQIMFEIQADIGAIIFKTFTINSQYLSQYDHRIHKS